MNLLLIKKYCEEKKKALKYLAVECDITEQTLHRCIKDNKMQAGDLEKIALALQVDISTFFNNTAAEGKLNIGHNIQGSGSITGDISISECRKELQHMKQLIIEKDKMLEEKERLIQVLLAK
ncbi:MAG: helix-turn-helix domain-containing protein [Phocaeicola sp.]